MWICDRKSNEQSLNRGSIDPSCDIDHGMDKLFTNFADLYTVICIIPTTKHERILTDNIKYS